MITKTRRVNSVTVVKGFLQNLSEIWCFNFDAYGQSCRMYVTPCNLVQIHRRARESCWFNCHSGGSSRILWKFGTPDYTELHPRRFAIFFLKIISAIRRTGEKHNTLYRESIPGRKRDCIFCITRSLRTGCWARPAAAWGVLGVRPSVQSGREITLTTHFHLTSTLRMSGLISSLPHLPL